MDAIRCDLRNPMRRAEMAAPIAPITTKPDLAQTQCDCSSFQQLSEKHTPPRRTDHCLSHRAVLSQLRVFTTHRHLVIITAVEEHRRCLTRGRIRDYLSNQRSFCCTCHRVSCHFMDDRTSPNGPNIPKLRRSTPVVN